MVDSPPFNAQIQLFRDLRTIKAPALRALQPKICLQCWMVISIEDAPHHVRHNQTSDFSQMEEANKASYLQLCQQYDRLTVDKKQAILMKVQPKILQVVDTVKKMGNGVKKAQVGQMHAGQKKKNTIQEVDLTNAISKKNPSRPQNDPKSSGLKRSDPPVDSNQNKRQKFDAQQNMSNGLINGMNMFNGNGASSGTDDNNSMMQNFPQMFNAFMMNQMSQQMMNQQQMQQQKGGKNVKKKGADNIQNPMNFLLAQQQYFMNGNQGGPQQKGAKNGNMPKYMIQDSPQQEQFQIKVLDMLKKVTKKCEMIEKDVRSIKFKMALAQTAGGMGLDTQNLIQQKLNQTQKAKDIPDKVISLDGQSDEQEDGVQASQDKEKVAPEPLTEQEKVKVIEKELQKIREENKNQDNQESTQSKDAKEGNQGAQEGENNGLKDMVNLSDEANKPDQEQEKKTGDKEAPDQLPLQIQEEAGQKDDKKVDEEMKDGNENAVVESSAQATEGQAETQKDALPEKNPEEIQKEKDELLKKRQNMLAQLNADANDENDFDMEWDDKVDDGKEVKPLEKVQVDSTHEQIEEGKEADMQVQEILRGDQTVTETAQQESVQQTGDAEEQRETGFGDVNDKQMAEDLPKEKRASSKQIVADEEQDKSVKSNKPEEGMLRISSKKPEDEQKSFTPPNQDQLMPSRNCSKEAEKAKSQSQQIEIDLEGVSKSNAQSLEVQDSFMGATVNNPESQQEINSTKAIKSVGDQSGNRPISENVGSNKAISREASIDHVSPLDPSFFQNPKDPRFSDEVKQPSHQSRDSKQQVNSEKIRSDAEKIQV